MIIYQGTYLNITFEKEHSRFVQYWSTSPNTIALFKSEMLTYTAFYKTYKPTQSLWLQQNFTLQLDATTQNWIETHVNRPCKEYGNKKLAFVVSQDVLAHIEVINSFEEVDSCIYPKHFASEEKARFWLTEGRLLSEPHDETKIVFEGIDKEGNGIIKFKNSANDITQTLQSCKKIIKTNDFIKKNLHKYTSLTKREKEILHLYTKIHKPDEIANQLCISVHTIRTHWKNIKNKLDIHVLEEILLFAEAFETINSRE